MDYCYKFGYLSLKFDLFSVEQKHRISQLSYTLQEKVFPFGFFSLPYFSSLDSPLLVCCCLHIPSYLLHSEEKNNFSHFHWPLIILPTLTRSNCNSPVLLWSWSALSYLEQCNMWGCEMMIYVFLRNLFLPCWTESQPYSALHSSFSHPNIRCSTRF